MKDSTRHHFRLDPFQGVASAPITTVRIVDLWFDVGDLSRGCCWSRHRQQRREAVQGVLSDDAVTTIQQFEKPCALQIEEMQYTGVHVWSRIARIFKHTTASVDDDRRVDKMCVRLGLHERI
jgi:hypothetical protein